jgi:hypothetical protein
MQQTVPAKTTSRSLNRNGGASAGFGMPGGGGIHYTGDSANVSRLLDSISRGYDKRLRPNYNGMAAVVFYSAYLEPFAFFDRFTLATFWRSKRAIIRCGRAAARM